MNIAYYSYIADKYDIAQARCMTLYTMATRWRKSKDDSIKQKLEDTINHLPYNEVLAYEEMAFSTK
jgi:hypothetical protein